jgi:hypothetical protein
MTPDNQLKPYTNTPIFDTRHVEAKSYYYSLFKRLPNIHFIDPIDGENACIAFRHKYAHLIVDEHVYSWYNAKKKAYAFDRTIIRLKDECLLEMNRDYCEIMHNGSDGAFLAELTTFMLKYKERKKRKPQEVNLIVKGYDGLELKTMEIKPVKLNLDLFYEDDFKPVDEIIRARLNKKEDKGIVLLHGLPGTGKTTYLRYLISRIKKKVLVLSPNVAADLMDPVFIQLLIDNPDSVVVIEDAENIIMNRRNTASPAVSNLLNISDGLLADFLNVQLVCTFNSPLTMIDAALMRKGRLIAKYEFGNLSAVKAQKLSNRWGYDKIIDQPMTLAEIATQHEQDFEPKRVETIGFRREVLNNWSS